MENPIAFFFIVIGGLLALMVVIKLILMMIIGVFKALPQTIASVIAGVAMHYLFPQLETIPKLKEIVTIGFHGTNPTLAGLITSICVFFLASAFSDSNDKDS